MPPVLRHRLSALLALPVMVSVLACASCGNGQPGEPSGAEDAQKAPPPAPVRDELHIFAFGRVKGYVAPCGCTTEPLGGLPYAFGYIESASSPGGRLVLEPGSFLYPDPKDPDGPTDEAGWDQADQRATLLHQRFSELGEGLVSGLGPFDLMAPNRSGAVNKYALPRVLANSKAVGPPMYRMTEIKAGTRTVVVGVTGVTIPGIEGSNKLGPLTKPGPAVKRQVEKMRKAGAEITVAIVHGPREEAEAIARETENLDFVVVGLVEGAERQRLGAPVAKLGDTYVLEPGEQLQTISHVTLSLAPGAKLAGTADWELQESQAAHVAELERLEARLEKFSQDPSADPAYLDRLRTERDALRKKAQGEATFAAQVGLVVEQVKVTCHREVDAHAKKALTQYDAWVARENKKRFAGIKPPTPGKGEVGYVGMEECDMCHDEAVAYWKETVHSRAYQTLIDDNKQYDLSCVGCHVTGFRKPGGSEVVENEGLTSVQCEVCHGPGAAHAEDPEKNGTPQLISREAPEEVCAGCHTPDHSDTFDYKAYLRDILGPGHGAKAREALGDGPTGRELRAAGLAKAGGACQKM